MILSLKSICKQFEHTSALSDVTVSIPSNSIFALLGPNGAGKTTLLRIITSILKPDSGQYFYKEQLVNSTCKPLIGYLPEERGLYKKMKVAEHLIYLAQLRGITHVDAKKSVKLWLEKFGIADRENQLIQQLSKGLQQKVQFIATIIHNPEIVILDEPFSGFDPINAQLIKEEILDLKKLGKTIIISTHRMESVEELCEEIALLNYGKIVLNGNKELIKKSYGKSHYLIKGQGTINQLTSGNIISQLYDKNTLNLIVKPIDNQSINTMLLELIAQGFKVEFVEEQLPSMHDIFIEKINLNNV
jgi:ABC-2 type transport system ATP-binding protein